MRSVVITLLLMMVVRSVMAQDAASDLIPENIGLSTQRDPFGLEVQVVEGALANTGSQAYTGITLFAEAYDAADALVGEGVGYPVNACGTALLDLTLQPAESLHFSAVLDLFEQESTIDRVEIIPEARAVPATAANPFASSSAGITQLSDAEVVAVEWLSDTSLRFGVGCDAQVFSRLKWYTTDTTGEDITIDAHPDTQYITEAMRRQTGLQEDALFERSYLSFHPSGRRMVYQNDLNVLVTAEPDGSYRRVMSAGNMARFSLHGIHWLQEDRFMPYYFGAYGDPVRYFLTDLNTRILGQSIDEVTPSFTVPGVTPDGERVIITATLDGVTGYYLKSVLYDTTELLFEAVPPGNNYPAPVYLEQGAAGSWIYVVRLVNDEARLECYSTDKAELTSLAALPLNLTSDDRAWMWPSPDGSQLALAANGHAGGLWIIDLSAFADCGE